MAAATAGDSFDDRVPLDDAADAESVSEGDESTSTAFTCSGTTELHRASTRTKSSSNEEGAPPSDDVEVGG